MTKTKPTSDEIATQIASEKTQLAALVSSIDQAEAKAVALVHDADKYEAAIAALDALKLKEAAQRRRLDMLDRAHDQAVGDELDTEIAKLETAAREATQSRLKVSVAYEAGIKETQRRYETDTADWRTKLAEAQAAERGASIRLKDAGERRRRRTERGTDAGRRRELSEQKQAAEAMTAAPDDRLAEQGRKQLAAVESQLARLQTT